MVRIFATLALTLAVTACGQTDDASLPATPVSVTHSTSEFAPTGLAKTLFGAESRASSQAPAAFGGYAKGCLAGAVELPETGPTWQAMRLSRNRNWAHPEMIAFIERFSRKVARKNGWNGVYIGDLSQPRGGPMNGGHRSHQIGLDADIWLRSAMDLNLSLIHI